MSTATVETPTIELFDVPQLEQLQAESTTETIDETIPLPSPGTDAGDCCDHDRSSDRVAPSSETAPTAPDNSATDTSAPHASLADAPPRAPATDDASPDGAGQPGDGRAVQDSGDSQELADWQDRYRAIQERITTVLIELNAAKDRAKHLGKLLKELGEEAAAVKAGRPEATKPVLVGPTAEVAKEASAADPTAVALADDLANPDPNAWRSIPISQLGLKPALETKLIENDITTIGQLEDLRAGPGLRSIKGIGQSKADAIEEAVLQWLSKNRDSRVLAEAAAGQSGSDLPTSEGQGSSEGLPAAAGAEQTSPLSTSMPVGISRFDPDAERAAGIEDRVIQLLAAQRAADERGQGEECLEPEIDDQRFWNGGVEAYDRGVPVRDCPIDPPGPEQDDWLRGWLTANLAEETQV